MAFSLGRFKQRAQDHPAGQLHATTGLGLLLTSPVKTGALIGKKPKKKRHPDSHHWSLVGCAMWGDFIFFFCILEIFPYFTQWTCSTFKSRNYAIFKSLQRVHDFP